MKLYSIYFEPKEYPSEEKDDSVEFEVQADS
jgi:hypothetical protein